MGLLRRTLYHVVVPLPSFPALFSLKSFPQQILRKYLLDPSFVQARIPLKIDATLRQWPPSSDLALFASNHHRLFSLSPVSSRLYALRDHTIRTTYPDPASRRGRP